MGPKIDVMERGYKNYNILSASKQGLAILFPGRFGLEQDVGTLPLEPLVCCDADLHILIKPILPSSLSHCQGLVMYVPNFFSTVFRHLFASGVVTYPGRHATIQLEL
jgi:hypothetical protein